MIRHGIIGCGSMGREHILNLRALDGVEVTAIRDGLPAEIGLEKGVRAVASDLAAHRSLDLRRPVAMREVLPAGG